MEEEFEFNPEGGAPRSSATSSSAASWGKAGVALGVVGAVLALACLAFAVYLHQTSVNGPLLVH